MFRGEVLSVKELQERALAEPDQALGAGAGVLHSAAGNAAYCSRLLAAGDSLDACWRFGVLQTLDDYNSTLHRGGTGLAAQVFTDPPDPTGSVEVDAAFAALAEHLAERDGWDVPAWVQDSWRVAAGWLPSVPSIFHADALRESPRAFRERGIFITARSLDRA